MLATVAQVLLGLVLIGSAAAKLATPARSRAALATFGLASPRARAAAWAAAIGAEALLGLGAALGLDAAAWAAAGLMLAFATLLARALRHGHAGEPCGCLGPRSQVSRAALARTLALAAAFALLPLVPNTDPTTDGWLALAIAATLVALAGLALLVLALAREIGELRLALGPQPALELEGEGPPRGERVDLIDRFAPGPRVRFALAVFSSHECPICQEVGPAVRALARDPLLAVEVFMYEEDPDAWELLTIPGSPYAVVLALDGTVLAQGTFNTLRQLESLVATAERREREGTLAHA